MNLTILFEIVLPIIILFILLIIFKNNLLDKMNSNEQVGIYFSLILGMLYEFRFNPNGLQISQLIIDFCFIGIIFLIYLMLKESGFFKNLNFLQRQSPKNFNTKNIENIESIKEQSNKNEFYYNLTHNQYQRIFLFLQDHNIILHDITLDIFKEKFLQEKISINCEIPVLREFYNHLSIVDGVSLKPIKKFLSFFEISKTNKVVDYKTFTKFKEPKSKLTYEINELFREF